MVIGPEPSITDGQESLADAAPTRVVGPGKVIEGRSLGRIAWTRLKRDKVAIAGGITVLVLIAIALLAPVITSFVGGDPDVGHRDLIDRSSNAPIGSFGGASAEHPMGLEPENGRDVFSRIVYGA